MAPVVKIFQASTQVTTLVYTSGQHTDLVEQALLAMELKVDGRLELKRVGNSLTELTRKLNISIGRLVFQTKPDMIVVHGDTSTALVAAIVARTQNKRLAHVEAGLRTYELSAPYPEEANRQLITRLADYHFAPTAGAKINLLAEKIASDKILVTGNTGIDSLEWVMAKNKSHKSTFTQSFGKQPDNIPLLLVTAHRRENQTSGISELCAALCRLAEKCQLDIAYVAHPDPALRAQLEQGLGTSKVQLLDPLDYQDFVWLMTRAKLILTDSGGIQEEAPTLKVPVLLMREATERPEALKGGLEIIGMNEENIVRRVQELISDEQLYHKMIPVSNPYGDGKAAGRILDFVLRLNAV